MAAGSNEPATRKRGLPVALAVASLLSLCCGKVMASPRDAIKAGTMQDVIGEVVALYKRHGLSWADWITWDIEPYTTTFWYYDPFDYRIVVGDLPKPEEVASYWTTWSAVLTDGNWTPDTFFVSTQEALEIARFNQWLLATHESAHAITYRYDFDHNMRHDYDVNCREYHADRLTAAILQDEASRDADFARWKARYLELVTQMGASIPKLYRVAAADYPALEARCEIIAIDQPAPDRMQAYASAFFTRYEALLSAELPPLGEVFDKHLQSIPREQIDAYAAAPEWTDATIETIRQVPATANAVTPSPRFLEGLWAQRASAFAPNGTIYAAESVYDPATRKITVIFGPAEEKPETIISDAAWPRPSPRVLLRSIAAYGPDEFVATFDEREQRTNAVRFRHDDGRWTMTVLAEDTGAATAFAYRIGERLIVGFSGFADDDPDRPSRTWETREIDRKTGDSPWQYRIPVEGRYPRGADATGRLYFLDGNVLVRAGAEPLLTRIIGNALKGSRDGDSTVGELDGVELVQTEPDGSLLILQDKPGNSDTQLVRRIRTGQ